MRRNLRGINYRWTLVLCALFCQFANAQLTIQVGTGTTEPPSTLFFPVLRQFASGTTTSARSNVVFTASELAAAGMYNGVTITSLQFNKTNQAHFLTPANYKLYMANSGKTSLNVSDTWANILISHTKVYDNASFDIPDAPGWATINITPFVYTGGSIEIACDLTMTGGIAGASDGFKWQYTDAVPADRIVASAGNTPGTTLNNTAAEFKHRPNTRFTFTEAVACTTPPEAGTTQASKTNVCITESFDLTISGNSVGGGQTYQWQKSTDNLNWTNIDGATTPGITQTQLSTSYYRAMVTCSGLKDSSAVVLITSPALVHGTFTINSTLPTSLTNFASFGDAINRIKCGIDGPVVFNVEPGTGPYVEQIKIPAIYGTSTTNTITINGNGTTLSFNAAIIENAAGIYLDGTDHLTIDSLVINGSAGTYGWGVFLTNGADSNTIKRCTINVSTTNTSPTNHVPIAISGLLGSSTGAGNNGNYNTFINNRLTGGYYGISIYGGTTAAAYNRGNKSIGNTITEFYAYGHYVYGQEDAVVSGNDITRPTRATSSTTSGVFLSTSIGALIEKNRVHNLYGGAPANTTACNAFYITNARGSFNKPNKIINNLVYDIAGNGTLYGIYSSGSDSSLYYHNTIVLDNAATTTAACFGFYQTTTAIGVDFRNNIIYITRGGTGQKRAVCLFTPASSVQLNNNVYWMAAPGTDNKIGQYGNISYSTLADWKTANSSAYDQSSLFVDPLFLNISIPDEFKPSEPAINNFGASLGIATDIYGAVRTSEPDPGAVEFALNPCTNPPTPGIATTTDANPCSGASFTLNLTGNSSGANQTYQWQWSTDHNDWTNIGTLQTTPVFATSQTASHYYRVEVRCSGGAPAYSDSVFVKKPVVAGNYTINNLLPTAASNFASFGEAVAFLKCGITSPVVFTVEPFTGPYTEKLVIGAIAGTSAVNTITFKGNGATLSYAAPSSTDRTVLILDGADHIIIDSLNIDASLGASNGWGILLTNVADSNIIRNCSVITKAANSSDTYSGILINGSATGTSSAGNNGNYNLFENNTVTGGYYGFYIYGSNPLFNRANKFVNNKVLDSYSHGFFLYGQKQATLSKNDVSRPTRNNSASAVYGIYMATCGDSLLVEKNRVHNMFDAIAGSTAISYSIYATNTAGNPAYPSRLENNLVHSINSNSSLYGIYCDGGNWNIYHNTLILDNPAATTSNLTYALYANGAGMTIKNNIAAVSRGGTGPKYCVYLGPTFAGAINNNDWLMTAPAGTTNYVAFKGVGYTTLTDWKLSNGSLYDQKSVSIDPIFQQLTPGDFFPSEPGIINMGENLGVLSDILDTARTATPDLGAYEFKVADCVSPPTAGVIVTTSSTVCPNTSFSLNLTGNSAAEGITYQWQMSANNADWVNIGAPSTLSFITVSQAASSYYQCLVKCNSGTPVATPSLLITSPGLVPAGVYTINNTQATGGANFQSFGDAVNFIACGIAGPITFNVTANTGPYNEQVSIPQIKGTSAVNTVTWNGNGNTLLFNINNAEQRGVLTLNGADHMIFDSLNIDASGGTYGYGIILTNIADSNVIRKCTITSSTTSTLANYAGIIMAGGTGLATTAGNCGSGNLVMDNSITGGYYGVSIYGSTADTIQYNKVINNTIKDFYFNGFYTTNSRHTTFSKNDLSRPTRTNAGTSGDVVLVQASFGGIVIEKNKIHNIMDAVSASTIFIGFNINVGSGTAVLPNRLENNMIYNIRNTSGTALCYAVSANGANYWKIAHNSFHLDDATATGGNTYGLFVSSTLGTTVYNNIISITRGGTGTKYCVYTASTGVPASNNNVLYMNSPAGTNAIGYYLSPRTTLAAWQLAGFDANSVSTNPLFIDAASGDLRPQQSSIFTLGNGLTGVTTDIFEATRRVNNPTPGAYEMSGPLAATMLSLDAIRVGANVKVSWATITEVNSKGFDIERSQDGRNFQSIGHAQTKSVNGNSNSKLSYEFLDRKAPSSDVFYRIKQMDNNGDSQNSNVVLIKGIGNNRFDFTNVFPNPVRKGDLNLQISSQDAAGITLVVTDVFGKTLLKQQGTVVPGTNNFKVNVSNLPVGTYFIRAICTNGCETTVRKFVIQ